MAKFIITSYLLKSFSIFVVYPKTDFIKCKKLPNLGREHSA